MKDMMNSKQAAKLLTIGCAFSCALLTFGQAKPSQTQKPKPSLDTRLKATEEKFAKMATNSGKASAQLDKIGSELDGLLKALHSIHLRIKGKPAP
jgi:hypothetical protein